jgi:hypothetical protein
MDGAKWTQFGPCSSPVLCIMEGKVKRVAGDSIVSDLLANVTHDKYGLNPQLDIFLAEAPANTADFDTKFNELDQTIRENVSACSKKTYKSLDSWLKKEAQAANTTAESASVEYEGYGNNTVIAIENYFAHANTKIMDLIAYVTDNKPVF